MKLNSIIAPFNQSKYLLLSSCLFVFPSLFGFYRAAYCLSAVSTSICICSINYWRNARYSIRRNVDMTVAYSGFATYVIYGCVYTNSPIVVCTGFPIAYLLYILYNF